MGTTPGGTSMATATLHTRQQMDDLYEHNNRAMHAEIHAHQRRYGGDYEDLAAEANYHFVLAAWSWQPERAKFHTWLRFSVRMGLMEIRRQAEHKARRIDHGADPNDTPSMPGDRLQRILDQLTPDAAAVVRLTLTTARPSRQRALVRRDVAAALLGRGWTGARVAEAFRQVREVLR